MVLGLGVSQASPEKSVDQASHVDVGDGATHGEFVAAVVVADDGFSGLPQLAHLALEGRNLLVLSRNVIERGSDLSASEGTILTLGAQVGLFSDRRKIGTFCPLGGWNGDGHRGFF
jgi:hypothetical protein